MSVPLLQVNDLKKHFPVRGGLFSRKSNWVYAVDGVSFEVERGETLSLVGESGCGKSTVGRAILRLFDITAGQVVLDGQRIDDLSPKGLRSMRRRVQVVFQDPFSSLNPRMRVRDILAEPIRNFGLARSSAELEARVAALHLHRKGPRGGTRTDRLRRGGLGSRRLGQGADRQPAAGPAARVRPRAALHQPRSGDRRTHDAPCRRDVSRQDRRNGATAANLRRAAASLHQGPAVGRAGAGAGRRPQPDHPEGRRAEPDQSTQRMPLPYPMSVCVRSLPDRGAGASTGGRGPVGGVSSRSPAGSAGAHVRLSFRNASAMNPVLTSASSFYRSSRHRTCAAPISHGILTCAFESKASR
jgi:ABC-type dipeptide/oligopeptide/nickel transport system ATPase subunit